MSDGFSPHFLHLYEFLDQVVDEENTEYKLAAHDGIVPFGYEPVNKKLRDVIVTT